MTQNENKSSQAVHDNKIDRQNDSNKKRLGTLKLWQKHIEALAKPNRSSEPLLKRYEDKVDSTSATPKQSH